MEIHATEDGGARFSLRAQGGAVWLTQQQLAELFQVSPPTIARHVRIVLAQNGRQFADAVRQSPTPLYGLDMILAIGWRVRSPRAAQFRQWASTRLGEYLLKGFTLDDERMQNPQGWEYFDELMRRIRAIRASDKRFFQKLRELLSLSVDYRDDPRAASAFFAEAMDKMIYAVTRNTAAEIVVTRCDPSQPDMAFPAWKGWPIEKEDVVVARNYLTADEEEDLNIIVTRFLDFAETRVAKRTQLHMADWREYLDSFLDFSERPVLTGAGRVAHEDMVRIAHARYAEFDRRRRRAEAELADALETIELEEAMRVIEQRRKAHA